MLGAIIGDIVGSAYEFNNVKTTDFELISDWSSFTDDSIMTLAVAKWLTGDLEHSPQTLVQIMQEFGRRYPSPMGGYGARFNTWLHSEQPRPYNSWGNGSAMRVSPVGLYAANLPEALDLARISAEVTHNHSEGIKGAQAIAAAVFLAKDGSGKPFIKEFIERMFGYDLSRKTDDIRRTYAFDESCQGSVPEAITTFLEGNSFEETVRLAVSLGGDSDTIACMAGAIAACLYPIPRHLAEECRKKFADAQDLLLVMDRFEAEYPQTANPLRPAFTPENISRLREGEVFVFGSNLEGMHMGGAARVAATRFGAIMGQGVGLQGQSYAIPTMQGGVETIKPYVDEFTEFARQHEELTFYVTRIGCDIAGFRDAEIAPLFAQAYMLDNVILPETFCRVIEELLNTRKDRLTHAHGITKTLADILAELNKEQHFTTPEKALESLYGYLDRFRKSGDDIAFLAIRILLSELQVHEASLFSQGVLNADMLRERVFNADTFTQSCDRAYSAYCRERLCNLIAYLNTFRRYTSAEQLINDLHELKVMGFNHCGPNERPYFFSIEADYPVWFFSEGLREHWAEITSNGVLDSGKMLEVLFKRHERGIRKYGLEAVIRHDYVDDGPCHPEVYFPKKIGTGPVYVQVSDRRYIRSCGEGKGPRSIPDEYESWLALKLLKKDDNYAEVSRYYIPKRDYTLPVFDYHRGRMEFDSEEEKAAFIKEVLAVNKKKG